MIIVIGEDGRLGLRDPDDFRRFEIEVASLQLGSAGVATALAPLGDVVDEDHAWISECDLMKLTGREQDEAWLRNFAAMKDKARRFGWVDDGRCAIRAHIKWPPGHDTNHDRTLHHHRRHHRIGSAQEGQSGGADHGRRADRIDTRVAKDPPLPPKRENC